MKRKFPPGPMGMPPYMMPPPPHMMPPYMMHPYMRFPKRQQVSSGSVKQDQKEDNEEDSPMIGPKVSEIDHYGSLKKCSIKTK